MSWTIPFALLGWIPFVFIVFSTMRAPRAALFSYLAGWMFLPVPGIELVGLDYDKDTAVPLVIFAAMLAFDGARLSRLRPVLVDLPVAIFCVVPLASSLANDLGWYDGLSGVFYQTVHWGLPYLTGRMYFASRDGLRELAIGIFAAGVLYAPLCLWEIRMSPQLHAWVYGVHQHEWLQTLRLGGYRPMVFMHHGLMLGLWMAAASLAGLALWTTATLRKLWGIPLSIAVPVLFATTVLGKSFGSIVLLGVGSLVFLFVYFGRMSLPVMLLLLAPIAYVGARIEGTSAGSSMVAVASEFSADRASSFGFRVVSEERLRTRAAEHPIFGWGGWGRSLANRFDDPLRTEKVTVDSLWIIVFGKHGLVGLASLLAALLLPSVVLWRRCPPSRARRAPAAMAWSLAIVLSIYALDGLVNAMVNPVFFLIAGGLCGLAALPRPAPSRARSPRSVLATQSATG
jgi:hypothetical protein